MRKMKNKYEYTVEELTFIVNELIVWRDGLEKLDNMFTTAFLKRIDTMLELKRFEETTITEQDVRN